MHSIKGNDEFVLCEGGKHFITQWSQHQSPDRRAVMLICVSYVLHL